MAREDELKHLEELELDSEIVLMRTRRMVIIGLVILLTLVVTLGAVVVYLMRDRAELKAQLDPATAEERRAAEDAKLHSLEGDWIQRTDAEYCHIAEIHDDVIEVYWYIPAENYRELYWCGTYIPPESADALDKTYSWTSVNDLETTTQSRRGSREEEKTFTYEDGKLSYLIWFGRLRMSVSLEPWTDKPD